MIHFGVDDVEEWARGFTVFEFARQRAQRGRDAAERIADFVRDAGEEFADRGQTF